MLLEAYHRNDPAEAWRCAFDAALLQRAGARLEADLPVRVERPAHPPGPFTVLFELPHPARVRLDRLLAAELAVPRSRLNALLGPEVNQPGHVRDGLLVALGTTVSVPERGGCRNPGPPLDDQA